MAEQPSAAISRFEETREPDALVSAASLLEQIDIRKPGDLATRRELRRGTLHGWFALFNAIDAHLDTSFDPDDLPAVSLQPPPAGEVRYPPGVDPEAVKEDPARRAYEKSIEQNDNKTQTYNLQTTLRRLDEKATRLVKALVSESYLPIPHDREELAGAFELLREPERKSKLREAIPLLKAAAEARA